MCPKRDITEFLLGFLCVDFAVNVLFERYVKPR